MNRAKAVAMCRTTSRSRKLDALSVVPFRTLVQLNTYAIKTEWPSEDTGKSSVTP